MIHAPAPATLFGFDCDDAGQARREKRVAGQRDNHRAVRGIAPAKQGIIALQIQYLQRQGYSFVPAPNGYRQGEVRPGVYGGQRRWTTLDWLGQSGSKIEKSVCPTSLGRRAKPGDPGRSQVGEEANR